MLQEATSLEQQIFESQNGLRTYPQDFIPVLEDMLENFQDL